MRVRALQPFVGVWGNQSYVFSEGDEKDVPDGLGESVTRSGTLAVRVETPRAKPTAPAAAPALDSEVDAPEESAAPLKRSRKN